MGFGRDDSGVKVEGAESSNVQALSGEGPVLGRSLNAEVEEGQEEEPKAVHEVPEVRGDFGGYGK